MADTGRKMIRLFEWIEYNGSTLRDYGLTEPLYLYGDPPEDNQVQDEYERTTVETLCDFDFLRREKGVLSNGTAFTDFKLTDKALRLLEALKIRAENDPNPHFWIMVVNGNVFMDLGITPPNLCVLVGEEWNDGDRIVITCHHQHSVLASDLRLALATTVYDGLTSQQIDEIEKIATDRGHVFGGSTP